MLFSKSNRSISAIMMLMIIAFSIQAQQYQHIKVYIPSFLSPKEDQNTGNRVAVILGLQIWRTYSTDTKERLSYDNADIFYNSEYTPRSIGDLERSVKRQRNKPNLIVWGRASQFGEGVVIEPNLIIPRDWYNNIPTKNVWSITFPSPVKPQTIAVDIPSRQYEFAPIVLDPKILKIVATNSTLLNIYLLKSTNSQTVGNLRADAVRAIRHEGDWSRVELLNTHGVGWVYLPQLTARPNEVVNFCGGVIRFLRKDWAGSIKLFEEVLKNDSTPTDVKLDAYLYLSMAHDKLQDEVKSFAMATEAYRLNPYSKTATQFLCMSYLRQLVSAWQKAPRSDETKYLINQLRTLIANNRILFSDNDEWLAQADDIVSKLEL